MRNYSYKESEAISAAYKKMIQSSRIVKKQAPIKKKNQRRDVKPQLPKTPKGVKVVRAKEVKKTTITPSPFHESVDNSNDVDKILRDSMNGVEIDEKPIVDDEKKKEISKRIEEVDKFLKEYVYDNADVMDKYDAEDIEAHADEIYDNWMALISSEDGDVDDWKAVDIAVEKAINSDSEKPSIKDEIFPETNNEDNDIMKTESTKCCKQIGKKMKSTFKDFTNYKNWCSKKTPLKMVAEADEADDDEGLSSYDQQAKDFLKETNSTVEIHQVGKEINKDWGDNEPRNKYEVTIKNPKGEFTFTFWDSINSTSNGSTPSEYDVLSAIGTDIQAYNSSRDLEDFASTFGYDIDDEESYAKAEDMFKKVEDAYKNASKIYSSDELEKLYLIECVGESSENENDGMTTYLDTYNGPSYEDYVSWCEDNDEEPAGDSSDEFYNWKADQEEMEASDFDENIKHSSACDGTWVAFASYYHNNYNGTFGPRTGEYHNVSAQGDDFESVYSELISKCRGCNDVAVHGDGKKIYVKLMHHDGTETYTLIKLNDEGKKALEEINDYENGYSDKEPSVSTDDLDDDKYIVPVTNLF